MWSQILTRGCLISFSTTFSFHNMVPRTWHVLSTCILHLRYELSPPLSVEITCGFALEVLSVVYLKLLAAGQS